MISRVLPWCILLFMGAAWGLSFSLAKIATQEGGLAYGIAFWQAAISAFIIYLVSLTRQPFKIELVVFKLTLIVALLGAAIPSVLFYLAANHLPAGILAITTALVPVLTYSIALPLGMETASVRRIIGICLGWIAIIFLVVPKSSLPDPTAIPWVLLACIASSCYAGENIILANKTLTKLGPIRLACGMNLFAALILLPLTIIFDGFIIPKFPLGKLEYVILGLGFLNAAAYTLFVLTVQRFGPIFASQTGYVVTVSGVFWGILIFQEVHSFWVWLSLLFMIFGIALVTPKKF